MTLSDDDNFLTARRQICQATSDTICGVHFGFIFGANVHENRKSCHAQICRPNGRASAARALTNGKFLLWTAHKAVKYLDSFSIWIVLLDFISKIFFAILFGSSDKYLLVHLNGYCTRT